jgi:hypothetical protein
MEAKDIKTDIEVGKQIFEFIPNDIRPGWAGLILSRFDNYVKNIPSEIKELYPIINDQGRWKEAHQQFDKIRRFLLANKNYQPESYLLLAEIVAKVTYNASWEPAPFDRDNGWYIASLALNAAHYFCYNQPDSEQDDYLIEEVKSVILIFNRNKKFVNDLSAAKDFIIYKKIDDILWFDWDPIGINDIAPRDEYLSYVPGIFRLKKAGANKEEIAKCLFKIETQNMGIVGNFDNCLIVSDKIITAS